MSTRINKWSELLPYLVVCTDDDETLQWTIDEDHKLFLCEVENEQFPVHITLIELLDSGDLAFWGDSPGCGDPIEWIAFDGDATFVADIYN